MLPRIEKEIEECKERLRSQNSILMNTMELLQIHEPPTKGVDGPSEIGGARLHTMVADLKQVQYMIDHNMTLARIIMDALQVDPSGPEECVDASAVQLGSGSRVL